MISVCMAVYNGHKYIEQQIKSILGQLDASDELIISDDGSSDGTEEIISGVHDDRIVYVKNHGCHGVVGNFENALRMAKGDYIFLSDQDDVWLDNKVSVFKKHFVATDADVLMSDCHISDADLNIVTPSKFKLEGVRVGVIKNIVRCDYLGSCMAFRRACLDVFLPFPKNRFILHDIWIGLTAGSVGKFCLIDTPTMIYRRHGETVTAAGFGEISGMPCSQNPMWFKVVKRFVLLFCYVKWRVMYTIRR